jgi:hypothetical protein
MGFFVSWVRWRRLRPPWTRRDARIETKVKVTPLLDEVLAARTQSRAWSAE